MCRLFRMGNPRVVPWALFGLSSVLALSGIPLKASGASIVTWHYAANDVIAIAIFFVSGFVGALVASRLPSNPIGWLFIGLVVVLSFSSIFDGYAARSVAHGHRGGLVPWAAWYESEIFVAFLAVLLLTLLLFPDGHLASTRWRPVAWVGLAALAVITVGVLFHDTTLNDYPMLRNPAGIDSPVFAWMLLPGFLFFCASLVGAAASLVVRFRRSRGVERQQVKLFMASGVTATAAFLAAGIAQSFISEDLGTAITLLGVLTVPVAIGVAMLRYRLYEIDRVISRTLEYAVLTVILGAGYAGLVLAGQAVFSSFAGGSNLAIAVSTLVVAALLLPLRARVQRFVDRRFYRRRYDAQRTLDAFGARTRHAVELEGLRADLQAVVIETMQPAHVSVWLRGTRE
jgi:hypothetical protein